MLDIKLLIAALLAAVILPRSVRTFEWPEPAPLGARGSGGVTRSSFHDDSNHGSQDSDTGLSGQHTWFQDFHRLYEIKRWVAEMKNYFPNLITVVPEIGTSSEGRSIFAIKVTSNTTSDANETLALTNSTASKEQIWIQSLLDPSKWTTGAASQFIIDRLASLYSYDDTVTRLLDRFEFIFVPVANPDGYVYTWNVDAEWNKNRRIVAGGTEEGINLPKNFVDPMASPEPETAALQNFFLSNPNIIAAIDIDGNEFPTILHPCKIIKNDDTDSDAEGQHPEEKECGKLNMTPLPVAPSKKKKFIIDIDYKTIPNGAFPSHDLVDMQASSGSSGSNELNYENVETGKKAQPPTTVVDWFTSNKVYRRFKRRPLSVGIQLPLSERSYDITNPAVILSACKDAWNDVLELVLSL